MVTDDKSELDLRLEDEVSKQALDRRLAIEVRLKENVLMDREIQVGLKAFHRICDKWAIGTRSAEAILCDSNVTGLDIENLRNQLSYMLRVYRLVHDVIQGDDARKRRWIRRAIPSLDGKRPIDLMSAGPAGIAKVLDYLEFYMNGCSS